MRNGNQSGDREPLRSEEIQRQIQALSSRDLQLWSIGALVIVVLSAGFLAVIFPNLAWPHDITVDLRLLPQFFFGLITLIVLLNIYIIHQRRAVNAMRHELIHELIHSERVETLTMIDPATQLFNRAAVEIMLAEEIARANRFGTDLTLLMVKVDGVRVVNVRDGAAAGNRFILEIGRLLKSTLRGSDLVAHYTDCEFLAILPSTSEQQAEQVIRRLQEAVDQWNVTSRTGWEIHFVHGLAPYVPGSNDADLLKALERNMNRQPQKLVPVLLPVSSESGEESKLLV
jgi:diguanylate cyclase (GGDEF)-like protein